MTGLEFDAEALANQARALSPTARLVFGLSVAERLLPNYLAFQQEHKWGRHSLLRGVLDEIWDVVCRNAPALSGNPGTLEEKLIDAAPDTEKFGSVLASMALDAVTSLVYLVRLISHTNDDREGTDSVVQIATAARDTVDMFVQETEAMDPQARDLEERIRLHPLMQEELRRQTFDLSLLHNLTEEPNRLSELRRQWRAPAVSNVGIRTTN